LKESRFMAFSGASERGAIEKVMNKLAEAITQWHAKIN